MIEKITENFLKRRIRKYIRLGQMLFLRNSIKKLNFFIKKEFLTYRFLPLNEFEIDYHEPFMLLGIKVLVKENISIIGLQFLQNDNIGWFIQRIKHKKSHVISFTKDLKEFKQWKI